MSAIDTGHMVTYADASGIADAIAAFTLAASTRSERGETTQRR